MAFLTIIAFVACPGTFYIVVLFVLLSSTSFLLCLSVSRSALNLLSKRNKLKIISVLLANRAVSFKFKIYALHFIINVFSFRFQSVNSEKWFLFDFFVFWFLFQPQVYLSYGRVVCKNVFLFEVATDFMLFIVVGVSCTLYI